MGSIINLRETVKYFVFLVLALACGLKSLAELNLIILYLTFYPNKSEKQNEKILLFFNITVSVVSGTYCTSWENNGC
jgi:hypothetical protein